MNKARKLIFFDTETTGNTEKDYLCQIAYKSGDLTFASLYKPPIKIPPEASAIHHISNKMLEGKLALRESADYENIKTLFEDPDTVLVAHNAPFDLNIIKKEGIEPSAFICTLRVARHLDKDEKINKFNLQYLRYLLDFDIEANAHDAMGDVLVLEELYKRLKNKMVEEEEQSEDEALEKMIEISSHPSIFRKFNFGKHSGKSIEEVAASNRDYLEWLLGEKLKSGEIDEDWIYTLTHYLGK